MNQIYTYPTVLTGELLIWKGFSWRVQATSPNGGLVTLQDELTSEPIRAFSQNMVMVLELNKPTGRSIKVATAKAKRAKRHARKQHHELHAH